MFRQLSSLMKKLRSCNTVLILHEHDDEKNEDVCEDEKRTG